MANLSNLKDQVELEEDEFESFSYAMQLSLSITFSMALQSATELGVFDVMQKAGKGAQLSAHDIVSCLSFNNINNQEEATKMLDRILSLLTSHSILNCSVVQDQQKLGSFHRLYTMAPVARFFAPNSDGVSLAPMLALANDKIYLDVWSQFNDAIREGVNPFKRAHGIHLFEYCSLDSRFNQIFNTAMINHTTIVMKKVLECYKGFGEVKRLVDVGGGLGITINMITSKYPNIQGINFDLSHVIQHAPSYPGVEHIGGDMFQSVPNGDVVFMKWILHDWSDEYCIKLLKNCYDAIPDDGKVIVLESLLPIMPNNSNAGKSIALFDTIMMIQCPRGKERTENNFLNMATEAGFRGIRYECCVYGFWVMEFFK